MIIWQLPLQIFLTQLSLSVTVLYYLFSISESDKGAKLFIEGKNSVFNKWYWDNWIFTGKRMNLDPCFILYGKFNSKYVTDINVKVKNI